MANGKKSVLLYCDLIHTIEKMDNNTAGLFFKHYLRYINDLNPETDNQIIDITFESVKQNLKRDLKKWEERAEKSRENGSLGGRPKKEPKKPTGLLENQTGKNKPVNVTVTDTVKDKDIIKKAKAFPTEQDFLNFFNKGRKILLGTLGKTRVMCSTDSNNFKKLNVAYTKDEFKHAITMMSKDEWVKTASKFTISHLLAPKNFDKYLNKTDVRPMAQGLIEGN